MNNLRLLTGALVTGALVGGGLRGVAGQTATITLDEIFECAEKNSSLLRPYVTAIDESAKEIRIARAKRLPDVTANLSLSYIGDGFTTKRNFSDYHTPRHRVGYNGFSTRLYGWCNYTDNRTCAPDVHCCPICIRVFT